MAEKARILTGNETTERLKPLTAALPAYVHKPDVRRLGVGANVIDGSSDVHPRMVLPEVDRLFAPLTRECGSGRHLA